MRRPIIATLIALVLIAVGTTALYAAPALGGKVTETMDSGGYTYVCLESAGVKTWVAVPKTKVAVGDNVTVDGGMAMTNFTSKSLNREFPLIYFANGLTKAKK